MSVEPVKRHVPARTHPTAVRTILSKDNKDFRFQRSPRPDQPDHGAPEQSKKIEHHQPASADSPALASRFGFATGTRPFGCSATCCGWSCRRSCVGATVKHAQPVGWTALTCDPRRQDDGERQALPPPPSIGKGRKKVIALNRYRGREEVKITALPRYAYPQLCNVRRR